MSLLKQLLVSVTLAVCVILISTLWLGLNGAKGFFGDRLQADAQNAASSLALSLSQPGTQDPVTQELLITALFDTGRFRSISFTAPSGEVLVQRDRGLEDPSAGLPSWFDAWFPVRAPTAMRAVTDGEKQTGEVAVTPLDAPARTALWRMTSQVLLLVLGAGILWAIFAIFLIRWLRKALQEEISAQLHAIADDTPATHGASARAPRIKELAQVQNVIASVRERVRATADEHNRQIETLEVELNTDPVTGAANRKYFLNELRRALNGELDAQPEDATPATGGAFAHNAAGQASGYGHVLIFRQRDLGSINALHDRQTADAWLRSVGVSVSQLLNAGAADGRPRPQFARLNGSDFVVLLPGYDGPDTTDVIERLRQALDALRIRTADDRLCRWSYALTDYGPGCDVAAVLTRLDHGLMRAENAGHDDVEYIAASEYRSLAPRGAGGEMAWKELIHGALAEGRIELSVQPSAYRDDDVPGRHEAHLVLRDPDDRSTVSGYLFMPPAVRLGLSGQCDLRAVDLGMQWVQANPGTLVIRISLASLLQPTFLLELEEALAAGAARPEAMRRLILEIDAHGFVAYLEEVEAFCLVVARAGASVGVRRLSEQPAALLRLHRTPVRYVKLGGELISDLLQSPGATQLIAAITEVAIAQGVKIYAHDVPNVATATLLQEYGALLHEDEAFDLTAVEEEGGFVDH